VHACVLLQRILQLSKTFDRLREPTIPFQNVANGAVNDKHRNLELNRTDVTVHIRIHHGKHTLTAVLDASSAESRINIMFAHFIRTVFGVKELSDNAVE